MAGKINIEKLAERLSQLDTKSNAGSSLDFITIKNGRNIIRVLPPKGENDWFAKEVFLHYSVGKSESNGKGTTVICPTTEGDDKSCPVCELAKELFKLSKKKGDSMEKQAKEIMRKKRVYYNAIDRSDDLKNFEQRDIDGTMKWFNIKTDEEECPVKILATGIGIYKDIMGLIVDPEYGDVTDPNEGLDLIITKEGTGFNTSYKVKTLRKESPIGFDQWEECLHDLEPLGKITRTYDEIADLMDGSNDPEEIEEEVEKVEDKEEEEDTESGGSLQDEIQQALKRRRANSKK